MEFFKRTTHIDFMSTRKPALIMSIVVLLAVIASLAIQGLNFGVDFTGGVTMEVDYPGAANLDQIRQTVGQGGFAGASAQHFGKSNAVLIHLEPRKNVSSKNLSGKVMDVLHKANPKASLQRVEFVGPQVGNDLARKGALALLLTLILILIYVAIRFEYRFALGAVAATVHDVVFVVGFFSITRIQFDLTVLAAVLAVMGYSLNDTVVVFDRIREDFRKMRRGTSIDVINAAINETLSRTIMTSSMTLLVVIALLAVGGEVIRGFAIALIVGIVVGTYSSIYIASATSLMLGVSKTDLMKVKKQGEPVDDMP